MLVFAIFKMVINSVFEGHLCPPPDQFQLYKDDTYHVTKMIHFHFVR